MFCMKCGTDLPDDSRFCRSCGQMQGVVSTGGGAAAAMAPAQTPERKKSTLRSPKRWAIFLALIALTGAIGLLWPSFGHKPIDLGNKVVNVHAHSWYALTFEVPYDGFLTISAAVQSGNPMTMYLTNHDGYQALEISGRNTPWEDFAARDTLNFQHTARIAHGSYYFVMRDDSLGILSHPASDVAVRVHLEP
jgi:hypothetical protein